MLTVRVLNVNPSREARDLTAVIRMSFCPQDLGLGQARLSGWGVKRSREQRAVGSEGPREVVEGGDVCVWERAASLSTVPKICKETRITVLASA